MYHNLINKKFRKLLFLIFALINLFNFHFKFRLFGNFVDNIRMLLLKMSGSKIGRQSIIHANVMILNPYNLEVGNNSFIGSNSEIFNYSKISIGDNVDIGTQLYINTDNHLFKNPELPINSQGGI